MEAQHPPENSMTRLDLSPFDQVAPQLYVHKFFCFEFPNPARQSEATEHLEQCLSATILRWPFITGQVGPSQCGNPKMVELRYSNPVPSKIERDILVAKKLSREEFPWTYQELAEAGMPPTAMKYQVLSCVPEWPNPAEWWPALSIQANFFEGGLILCFAFHHVVADGGSFITFIKAFGAGLAHRDRADSGTETSGVAVDETAHKRLGYTFAPGTDLRPLHSYPQYDSRSNLVRPPSLPHECVTKLLQFSASTVIALEQTVNGYLKEHNMATTTTQACLSSLIWVAVIRARQGRLNADDTAKMGVAVNVRDVTEPKLPQDYFGNAFLHATATMRISDLLSDDASANIAGISSSISVSAVALAASHMRRAVRVDNKFVMDRLKTFSSLTHPDDAFKAYAQALDVTHRGIDFSDWRMQGADVEFGIPGTTTSTVAFWRKAYSPNEGAYNILPRKGGSKSEHLWEVSIGLSLEDMDKVLGKDELGAWVTRVII